MRYDYYSDVLLKPFISTIPIIAVIFLFMDGYTINSWVTERYQLLEINK